MDFFKRTGEMAIGSRLRMLADRVTADAALIYNMYGVDIKPKWFPVFFVLAGGKALSVTEIAEMIGHSHPSVSNIVKEMKARALVRERKSKADARKTELVLTKKGRELAAQIEDQCHDVDAAVRMMNREVENHLWESIGEWERLLDEKSLSERVGEIKRQRETDDIQIVDFDDTCHHDAFRRLNERWIRDLFGVVEEADYYEFDHPMENIIDKGGYIFIATYRGEPVGTFAMMKSKNCLPSAENHYRPPYDFELVKFAVDPGVQGHRIGSRLIEACLQKARYLGAYRLFLESNRRCAAAVHLYEKYGFRHLKVEHSDYVRCDVQMELML
ncbi:MAG: GNAT family N-acetyltransferase [Prevotella sp.]|nr:GNAT family N-acetyltransferase [Prevotella sp.]